MCCDPDYVLNLKNKNLDFLDIAAQLGARFRHPDIWLAGLRHRVAWAFSRYSKAKAPILLAAYSLRSATMG